ncbi:anti-sigma factor family protein [Cupriavidus lacunae]|uniref:Anti-sigma factor n=1 Tax=Cupriavidus lacunae TaxID=2666307 RepID=A0A370NSP1_9BURK|nr:anti-sigma factor [Cupriavidus lacunae]RDK08563.1 anti-sigma factor [Cupriavidus lacunae]
MSEQQFSISEDDLHAYADGALSEERRAQVERALEQDPALAARVSDYFSLNSLLHERYDRVLAEPVPKRLQPSLAWHPGRREAANWPRFASIAATLVLGIALGVGTQMVPRMTGQLASNGPISSLPGQDGLARNAAVAHVVYMPDVVRPADIGADREQDFVQWLASRLGTNVHPPVLTRVGFELVGGRLLPDSSGGVAQFMYRDAKGERITLYISHRSTSANTTAFKLYQDGPVNVFYWLDGDFGYAVSGGIDRKVLLDISHDVYAQLTPVKKE